MKTNSIFLPKYHEAALFIVQLCQQAVRYEDTFKSIRESGFDKGDGPKRLLHPSILSK